MRWNRFVKSLLKAAVYILDQTAEPVDPSSDRASPIRNGAKSAVYPEENHTLRNILSFAVGLGLGVGAGILIAPASGEEIRSAIGDNIHDISSKVKEQISPQEPATGTD
jgi:YtxH-like protein